MFACIYSCYANLNGLDNNLPLPEKKKKKKKKKSKNHSFI